MENQICVTKLAHHKNAGVIEFFLRLKGLFSNARSSSRAVLCAESEVWVVLEMLVLIMVHNISYSWKHLDQENINWKV